MRKLQDPPTKRTRRNLHTNCAEDKCMHLYTYNSERTSPLYTTVAKYEWQKCAERTPLVVSVVR